EDDVLEQAQTLSFPSSGIQFFQWHMAQPSGGFPEPLRTRVVRDRAVLDGRPGASLPPLDPRTLEVTLRDKHGPRIRDVDVLSAALYPKVFDEYMQFRVQHSDISVLPTRNCFAPMKKGEEILVEIERGKTLIVQLTT